MKTRLAQHTFAVHIPPLVLGTVNTSVHATAYTAVVRVPTNSKSIAAMIISTGAIASIIWAIKPVAESVIYSIAAREPKVHAVLPTRLSPT
jgi:hypothetical protein